jgi:acetone carboxylase gamma subunit
MIRVLEYLEVTEGSPHEKVYRCLKCGHTLGSAQEDYKNFARKRTVPVWKNEPEYLGAFAQRSNTFVMREYYCPECAVMFEVDIVHKDEPQIHSIEIKVT